MFCKGRSQKRVKGRLPLTGDGRGRGGPSPPEASAPQRKSRKRLSRIQRIRETAKTAAKDAVILVPYSPSVFARRFSSFSRILLPPRGSFWFCMQNHTCIHLPKVLYYNVVANGLPQCDNPFLTVILLTPFSLWYCDVDNAPLSL